MSTQNNVVAFLAGAAAGGIAALLLAPERGERTRQRLRDGAEQVADRSTTVAKDTADVVVGKAKQQVGAVKSALAEGSEAYQREVERTAG